MWHDLAYVDPDPKLHALVIRHGSVQLRHALLHGKRTLNRADSAANRCCARSDMAQVYRRSQAAGTVISNDQTRPHIRKFERKVVLRLGRHLPTVTRRRRNHTAGVRQPLTGASFSPDYNCFRNASDFARFEARETKR